MAVSAGIYAPAFQSAFNKEMDVDSDTLKVMLCTSSYTPNRATHRYKSDITNEVTGTGYTAGGATAAGTLTVTAANSWVKQRANSTVYAVGDIVRPATGNGFVYKALTAGTTAGTIPTYPTTIGGTVTDGGVTWVCEGSTVFWIDLADVSWGTSTITARYAVIYDSTPASDATRPLISYIDFGADVVSSAGTFSITMDASGIVVLAVV